MTARAVRLGPSSILAIGLVTFVGVIAFAWLPYYPIWAVILIAMNVSVIWALTAHGRDLAES